VLVGLSTSHEIGLLAVAGVFIGFSLAASFLLPRRNPDFPGHGLRLFIALTIVLFLSMMAAVVVFAKEPEEEGGEATPTETQPAQPPPGQPPSTTGEQPKPPQGDPQAGKAVFASAGCTNCHTLKAANATGTIGPNLDQAKPPYDLVVERVTNGKSPMPSFKGQLSEKQIQDVAAFVSQSAGQS
jgi:mono/diheme cytochrome c family protein